MVKREERARERPNYCSLPDGFLSASGKEADAGGERKRMGETTDVYGLWLLVLRILPENMAWTAHCLPPHVFRGVCTQVYGTGGGVGGENYAATKIRQGEPGEASATTRGREGEQGVAGQVYDGLSRMWSAHGKVHGV